MARATASSVTVARRFRLNAEVQHGDRRRIGRLDPAGPVAPMPAAEHQFMLQSAAWAPHAMAWRRHSVRRGRKPRGCAVFGRRGGFSGVRIIEQRFDA